MVVVLGVMGVLETTPQETTATADPVVAVVDEVVPQRGGPLTEKGTRFGMIQLADFRVGLLVFQVLQGMVVLVVLADCLGIITHREVVAVALLLAF
jgi:hypothetical protein